MDMQSISSSDQAMSISEYAKELKNSGIRVVSVKSENFWVGYELGSLVRVPSFFVGTPAPGEVRQILWKSGKAVATYLLSPDESHTENAWLYVCNDHNYSLEKLSSPMRRNVRRGLRELEIKLITVEQLLLHGVEAFCDTRRRVGVSDGTATQFQRRFLQRAKCSAHVFWGAWNRDKLAAFLSVTEVDGWAEIEGCFSADAMLNLRPNDTLFFSVLSHYLTKKKIDIVSYGTSSIQESSNLETLHLFKTKVGFEARKVHRAFELHPFLCPIRNMTVLRLARFLLKLAPRNRILKKAVGTLAIMLNAHQPLKQ
ncbi:MAG: hypothetical protein WD425_16700 [Nitrospirales bacterium]